MDHSSPTNVKSQLNAKLNSSTQPVVKLNQDNFIQDPDVVHIHDRGHTHFIGTDDESGFYSFLRFSWISYTVLIFILVGAVILFLTFIVYRRRRRRRARRNTAAAKLTSTPLSEQEPLSVII